MAQIDQAYATVQELRASIGSESPDDDLVTADILAACSRLFDKLSHRYYGLDETAVPRVWIGNGTDCLKVYGGDNCPGIAPLLTEGAWGPPTITVKIDTSRDGTYATTLTSGQYELHPLNTPYGPEAGRPYKELVIPYWTTGAYLYWPSGYRVQVTAKYGYGRVPVGVKADVIEMAGIWLMKNPQATGDMNDLETVMATSVQGMSLRKKMLQSYYEPVLR